MSPRLFGHIRDNRTNQPEASYDEASYASYERRSSRFGGPTGGGYDQGFKTLFTCCMVLFAIVALRLTWLQVIAGPQIAAEAEMSRTNYSTLKARRGTIYDRNGNVLAMSEDRINVCVRPAAVTDVKSLAVILAKHLGGGSEDYYSYLTSDEIYLTIKKEIKLDLADKIRADLEAASIAGIELEETVVRVYPYGAVGSQVIGAVDHTGNGSSGIEQYYNDILSGTDGKSEREVGVSGVTPVAGGRYVVQKAVNGTDLVLALDIEVQRTIEEQIVEGVKKYEASSGSVIICDPKTGEIIAACSTPLFNVSDLSHIEEGALSLKAVSDSYEPGSIFKVLTCAIGIEEGLISPTSTWSVPAQNLVGDFYVTDDDGRDYTMDMSLREILRRSSNAGMSLVAQNVIGAERFAAGIERFGIGKPTGIDFPGEVAGLVRTLDEYDGASLGTMSFGQSLAVPLIQMVRSIGAIANGGVALTPHFVLRAGTETIEWPEGERVVSEQTATQLTDMMRTVIEEGTGELAQIEGFDVAGKTGTGEMASEDGGYLYRSYVSSLIGYAPASDPQLFAYVGLNGTPYLSSDSAAPLFSSIMGEALRITGMAPVS